jgi:hypothetical protein
MLPDLSHSPKTSRLPTALRLSACEDMQPSVIIWKVLRKVAIELQEERHGGIADFASRKRSRGCSRSI